MDDVTKKKIMCILQISRGCKIYWDFGKLLELQIPTWVKLKNADELQGYKKESIALGFQLSQLETLLTQCANFS